MAHEGLESTIHHINDRKISISKDDLLKLLVNTDPQKSPEITSLSQMIQDQVAKLSKFKFLRKWGFVLKGCGTFRSWELCFMLFGDG